MSSIDGEGERHARLQELPQPYWFSRAAPPVETEVAVVGGGIVGLSVAYWAAREDLSTLVLESERVAGGATGRGAGFLATGTLRPFVDVAHGVGVDRALSFWELTRENVALVRSQLIDAGVECHFAPGGSWRTARSGTGIGERWEESAELLQREGFEVEWVPAGEVRERTGCEFLDGALHIAADGGVDPVALCRGLVGAGGFQLLEGVRVRNLEPAADRIRLVWSGGSALAERVVVAANASIAPLLSTIAARLSPVTVQGLATEPAAPWTAGVWTIAPDGLCVRQLAEGGLLATGGAAPASGGARGFLELPTAKGQAELEAALEELLGGDGVPPIAERWGGTVAVTESGLPVVGALADGRVAYAVGCNGQGLSYGFALGRRLAAWLRGDESEIPLDLGAFDPVPAA